MSGEKSRRAEPGGKVVNVRSGEPFDFYVGRPNARRGFAGSMWASPYKIGRDGTREEVVEKYREKVLSDPFLLRHLFTLRGKVLGCWCAPERCHADVLLELAETVEMANIGLYAVEKTRAAGPPEGRGGTT